MGRLRVMSVFGTRPEAIKMAPVVEALNAFPEVKAQVLVTAQHRELLDQVLAHFGVHPDFDLDIMQAGQSLADITSRALYGCLDVFQRARPDLVLVHGDTTTTFAAALAAFYAQIPVGHVEAGLRTGQKYAPFPEELNRRLAGTLADLHFAPTPWARDNLRRENVPAEAIWVTGNTAIDALLRTVEGRHPLGNPQLERVLASGRLVLLMEAHRRENWGRPLEDACRALREVVAAEPGVELVYSVHPNPQVSRVVEAVLGGQERVHLVSPLPYPAWASLMARSHLIITDSGGLQEEAPSLGKPVILLRETTERPEALQAGTVLQVGTDRGKIVQSVTKLLRNPEAYRNMATGRNPYGDGRAAQRIAQVILWKWGLRVAQPETFTL